METKDHEIEDLIIKLLDYRENKLTIISELQKKYNLPILTLKSNYPGIYKENDITNALIVEIDTEVKSIFKNKVKFKKEFNTPEGLTIFYVVDDNPFAIKEEAIYIEDQHELGRLVDLDVFYSKEQNSISRRDLGHDFRKCYLCDKYAVECSRNKTHKYEELIEHIEKSLRKFLES